MPPMSASHVFAFISFLSFSDLIAFAAISVHPYFPSHHEL